MKIEAVRIHLLENPVLEARPLAPLGRAGVPDRVILHHRFDLSAHLVCVAADHLDLGFLELSPAESYVVVDPLE